MRFSHALLANAVFFFLLTAICFSYNYWVYYTCNGGSRRVYPLARWGEVFLVIAVPLLIIGLLAVFKEWSAVRRRGVVGRGNRRGAERGAHNETNISRTPLRHFAW